MGIWINTARAAVGRLMPAGLAAWLAAVTALALIACVVLGGI